MKNFNLSKFVALILVLSMLFSLAACSKGSTDDDENKENENQQGEDNKDLQNKDEDKKDESADGNDTQGGEDTQGGDGDKDTSGNEDPDTSKGSGEYVYHVFDESELVDYRGIVEHIFFHPVVAYPEMAFDGDSQEKGIDDWMVTVEELNKILDSLYEKGYILVDINTVWSETVNEKGEAVMVKNTLRIPKGRKPLIISIDDANYYDYMLENGFTHKLIIGEDGEVWSWGLDPDGKEVISQDLDVITIIDKFVKEHPDFSLNGAKGCIALTGYQGILGYRTNTDTKSWTDAQEANRLLEVEAVKPIVAQLKKTGWTFGSHTWGHISLASKSLSVVSSDMTRWMNEVGSIVGETSILFYPHGSRPDGSDVTQTGEVFRYLQGLGFRVFCSVGIESYSKIKSDICAVICDRMHPDGTTLRKYRDLYLKFYDAKDVFDADVRPDYGVSWE